MNKAKNFLLNIGYRIGLYKRPLDENSEEFMSFKDKCEKLDVLIKKYDDLMTYHDSPLIKKITSSVTNGLGFLQENYTYNKRHGLDYLVKNNIIENKNEDLIAHLAEMDVVSNKLDADNKKYFKSLTQTTVLSQHLRRKDALVNIHSKDSKATDDILLKIESEVKSARLNFNYFV